MPALTAKPASAIQNKGARLDCSRIGPSSQLPVRAAKMQKKANRQTVPTCDAIRYNQPAARTSFRCRSKVIRKKQLTVNNSHAIRKWSPLLQSNTSPMLKSSALHHERPRGAEVGYCSSDQYLCAYTAPAPPTTHNSARNKALNPSSLR